MSDGDDGEVVGVQLLDVGDVGERKPAADARDLVLDCALLVTRDRVAKTRKRLLRAELARELPAGGELENLPLLGRLTLGAVQPPVSELGVSERLRSAAGVINASLEAVHRGVPHGHVCGGWRREKRENAEEAHRAPGLRAGVS